ncbi:low molecular weight phosphotyrosine protein phosphatase, partial [Polaribacter sp.]|nr:low molecular weight phosphotyrosine protein phosphatase [Polaribacter sp.]
PENLSVPDPYHGGENGFDNVYEMLDKACAVVAEKL